MRFTRKIPGIRPPLPGRKDGAAPDRQVFSPGWTTAFVFVFLLSLFGIFQFCTLKLGGGVSEFWLETEVLGLSVFAIMSAVNGLVAIFALATFFLTGGVGLRRDWKHSAGFLLVLGLLGLTQVHLNRWKDLARDDREQAEASWQEQVESLRALREEITRLGQQHPWAGEYTSRERVFDVLLLVAPGLGASRIYRSEGYSAALPLRARLESSMEARPELRVEDDRLVLEHSWRRPARYAVVEWGARRYLVEDVALQGFLAAAEPATADGVFLRLGDEGRPLEGRPSVVQDLR